MGVYKDIYTRRQENQRRFTHFDDCNCAECRADLAAGQRNLRRPYWCDPSRAKWHAARYKNRPCATCGTTNDDGTRWYKEIGGETHCTPCYQTIKETENRDEV